MDCYRRFELTTSTCSVERTAVFDAFRAAWLGIRHCAPGRAVPNLTKNCSFFICKDLYVREKCSFGHADPWSWRNYNPSKRRVRMMQWRRAIVQGTASSVRGLAWNVPGYTSSTQSFTAEIGSLVTRVIHRHVFLRHEVRTKIRWQATSTSGRPANAVAHSRLTAYGPALHQLARSCRWQCKG